MSTIELKSRPRRGRARWRDDRGAAAVEFALIVPVLVMLLFGIIEFARAWNTRQTLTDAAREGTRIAVVNNGLLTSTEIQDSVSRVVQRAALRASIDTTMLTMTMVGMGTGETAEIQLDYIYRPLLGLVLKGPITIHTSSVMRNE